MCGIAGVIAPTPLGVEEHSAVRRMCAAITHRGPDDEGYFFDTNVALGMRRLSIIDLAGGHQPLHGEHNRTAVVCNGEIYNYVELRQELKARGYDFRTSSDVETILPLYSEFSADCVTKLRGMFAFALWDRDKRRLLLARDRFGEKPLYLRRDALGRLWFASEMKALLAATRGSKPEISPEATNLFLIYQYVPEPMTMLTDVRKLPAGHCLSVTPEELGSGSDIPESRPYWSYQEAPTRAGEPFGQIRAALEETARITLRSDVPVGVALSGGIDSSLIAALARRFHSGELKAFSVGYPGRPDNDERAVAESWARELDMPFFDVELSSDQFVADFPRLVRDMDDPIGDIAAYGYHAVSQIARSHGVPVLLSGLGADELFWGYDWVRQAVRKTIAKQRRKLPRWIARLVDAHPNRAVFYDSLDWMRDSAPLATALMTRQATTGMPREQWAKYFESDEWGDVPIWLMDVQNKTWLTSNCLALCDRLSMAHSVELRLPFLDYQLADLITGLRKGGIRDWDRPHKWLLIESVRDLLPRELLARKKRGFTPPVSEWMDRVVKTYSPLLSGGALVKRGILVKDIVDKLPNRWPAGLAYRLVLLELWARLYCDGANLSEFRDEARNGARRRFAAGSVDASDMTLVQ